MNFMCDILEKAQEEVKEPQIDLPSTLVSTLRLQVRLLNQDITLRVSQASQRWILSRFYHGNIKTEELGA
jgi:hypothetical protein